MCIYKRGHTACAMRFFFFQAEDGIRDIGVTGVQTCALPITGRHTAHQHRPDEVTIFYPFHPLCRHSLPVIRLYERVGEAFYVVRRADGRPLAIPEWMTRPDAANLRLVSMACLPVKVLLGLRNAAVTNCSSFVHNEHQEDQDAAGQDKATAPTLRRTSPCSRSASFAGGEGATPPDTCSVDASAGQDNPLGGQR